MKLASLVTGEEVVEGGVGGLQLKTDQQVADVFDGSKDLIGLDHVSHLGALAGGAVADPQGVLHSCAKKPLEWDVGTGVLGCLASSCMRSHGLAINGASTAPMRSLSRQNLRLNRGDHTACQALSKLVG